MSLILKYMYRRSVCITEDNATELLVAADQFLISGLVDACCEFLETQLCPEKCIGICMFAGHFHSCSKFQCKAKLYILQHFEEVVRVSEEFLELSVEHLEEIIGQDELNVKQEDVVLKPSSTGLITHLNRGRNTLLCYWRKVRMGLMTSDYFMNTVKNNALVMENEACTPVIINAMKAIFDLNMEEPFSSDLRNPLTRPRLPCAILLAIGGWSGSSPTNGIEAYDVRAERWVNVTQEDESPRAYHGAVVLDGFIYCIGGFDSVDYFNSVRKFNPINRIWHEVAPMYERRCYVSVANLDGYIYAIGGYSGHERLNTAECYDPKTNQWTLIAPMNERRSDASATSLQGKVYICGGFTGVECLFSAESFIPETNQWSLIAPMRSHRSGVGVIAYGGLVYAVGGFDGTGRLCSAEAYNPLTDLWHDVASMFDPRSNFGIEVVDDLLFVVGGFNGFSTSCDVECYNEKQTNGLPNIKYYAAQRDPVEIPEDEIDNDWSTSSSALAV